MTDYGILVKQAQELLAEEPAYVPFLANLSAVLYDALDGVNWAGFYLMQQDESLLLGPFQGKVACIRIGRGRGVCGAAASSGQTQLVADVHAFPGHIACDSASRSEIVVPMRDAEGSIAAVLDIDSPLEGRFSEEDRRGLEALVHAVEQQIRWGK